MSAEKKSKTAEVDPENSSGKKIDRQLGQILIDLNHLTAAQLKVALEKAKLKNLRIGEILISEGYINDKTLAEGLAKQYRFEYSDLKDYKLDPRHIKMLPEKLAKRHTVLVIDTTTSVPTVGISDPSNLFALNIVKKLLSNQCKFVVCPEQILRTSVSQAYSTESNTLSSIAKKLVDDPDQNPTLNSKKEKEDNETGVENFSANSIDTLINEIIAKAIGSNASDIHIEPSETHIKIRQRIDGVLYESGSLPNSLYSMLNSKCKLKSNLNIAEKRVPQDGGFRHQWGSKIIDIRLSTLPTISGEKIVMRILDKSALKADIEELGMIQKTKEDIISLTKAPYGIIYVTGPTGSGKTTTVYSVLNLFNKKEKNIITVEDPVEYQIDNINQVQVHPKAGLTFAGALKSILRQDPDIIMLGETRDKETAEIAIRASLTGHTVISTLHTNDSPSSINRLIDMGIEPFLVASSVIGIIAQRLVRILCPECKKPDKVSEEQSKLFGEELLKAGTEVSINQGCERCNQTGFTGRQAIFELLMPDQELKYAIAKEAPESELVAILRKGGFKTMRENAVEKILTHKTTVDEILKSTS